MGEIKFEKTMSDGDECYRAYSGMMQFWLIPKDGGGYELWSGPTLDHMDDVPDVESALAVAEQIKRETNEWDEARHRFLDLMSGCDQAMVYWEDVEAAQKALDKLEAAFSPLFDAARRVHREQLEADSRTSLSDTVSDAKPNDGKTDPP